MPDETPNSRYTNPGTTAARWGAQTALLRPYLHSQVRVEVHGKQHLRSVRPPFIAVANHSSHLDTALIFDALPGRLSRHLATGAAADHWFNHWYKALAPALFFNAYPIERPGKTSRKEGVRGLTKKLLRSGVPILLFPEGSRSRTGAMATFNPGSAALSISCNAPVLPIGLVGTFVAWPSNAKRVVPGRPTVHVVFGHPMNAAPGEIASEFARRIRAEVQQLHDSVARAHDLPTLDDFARAAALRELTTGRPAPAESTRNSRDHEAK